MKYVFIFAIRIYRHTLSYFMGRTCRYIPSCSDYADQALRAHGAWRGGWLTLSRVLRCHPWALHGLDPVPENIPAHGLKFWKYGRWTGKHITERFDDPA